MSDLAVLSGPDSVSPIKSQLEGHLNKGIGAAFLLLNERFPIAVKFINNEVKILHNAVEEQERLFIKGKFKYMHQVCTHQVCNNCMVDLDSFAKWLRTQFLTPVK